MNRRQPLMASINEAASRLGVPRAYLTREVKEGRLPGRRIGKRWMVPIDRVTQILLGEIDTIGSPGSAARMKNDAQIAAEDAALAAIAAARNLPSLASETSILQPPALQLDAVLYRDRRIPPRVRLERRVVWNLLAHLARHGFHPTGVQADEVVPTPTPEAVMEEAFNLDECHVYFRKIDSVADRWLYLVFGNDGWDCLSDWGIPTDPDGFDEAFDWEVYA